jgi:hypothetical protein
MPLWGNNDRANSKPTFPEQRQVVGLPLAQFLVTANSTTAGNTIVVTAAANTINTLGLIGSFVYALDANTNATGAISRLQDGSVINQNELAFFRSNNTVVSVDTANSIVRLANNVTATLNGASRVYFANNLTFNSNVANTRVADTILVTATRAANANNTSANVGSLSVGWVYVQRKTNNDGTVRYLKETLVALANATASNTSSGNTSFGQIVSGV